MEFRLRHGCRDKVFLYAIRILCMSFFFSIQPSKHVRRIDRSQLTLPILIVLLHVASGFFDALSSTQRLPLVNAVRRHRRVVTFRLVAVVLRPCPTLVRSRIPVIVILGNHRLWCSGGGSRGGGGGGRRRWRGGRGRSFVFVLVLGVVLNEERNLDEFLAEIFGMKYYLRFAGAIARASGEEIQKN